MPKRLTNLEVVARFATGLEWGSSDTISISGNSLFSYSACIAIREDTADGTIFIFSNRTNLFGGVPRSDTSSKHIILAFEVCQKYGKIRLVDGWADENKERLHVPDMPTHKTVGGLFRSFASWLRNEAWTGKWFPETGTKLVDWHYENDKLFDSNGAIVAVREHIFRLGFESNCNRDCSSCPAKFLCLTDKEGYTGIIFFIIKGKYEKLASEYLKPAMVVDTAPEGTVIAT